MSEPRTKVPPRGFEPPTNGLGNRCSIHLSYGGTVEAKSNCGTDVLSIEWSWSRLAASIGHERPDAA
jgi:hypothetical protein